MIIVPPRLVVPGERGGGRPNSGVTRVSVYTAEDEALGLQRQQQQYLRELCFSLYPVALVYLVSQLVMSIFKCVSPPHCIVLCM